MVRALVDLIYYLTDRLILIIQGPVNVQKPSTVYDGSSEPSPCYNQNVSGCTATLKVFTSARMLKLSDMKD